MWYEPKEKTLHSGSGATGNGQIFNLEGKYGALRLQVTGITSATITFEQCNDGGTTWDGIAGVNTETGTKVTTTTADGTFLFPITGVKKFRARISVYATGTIYVYATAVSAIVVPMEVYASLLAGTQIAGKVGIDQTTPGTTNAVAIDQTTDSTTNKVQARNATHGNFQVNATMQLNDADIATGNPIPAILTSEYPLAAVPWAVTATSAANTAVTATKAAEAAKIHYITGYLAVIRAAAAGADTSVQLKDGTTVLCQDYFGSGVPTGERIGITFPLPLKCTANTAVNLTAAAAGASAIVELSVFGYTI